MKDQNDFLWGMYVEHTQQGRHHETQRANVTNLIIIVAGGIMAFIGSGKMSVGDWTLALFLTFLGIFGVFFSAKQYERFRFHVNAAGNYRRKLEDLLGNGLSSIRDDSIKYHEATFWNFIVNLRLYYFWIVLHLLITVLGITLLILTLSRN